MNTYYNKDNIPGTANKLWEIIPTLGNGNKTAEKKQKEELILSRFRIGYTKTIHCYLNQSSN